MELPFYRHFASVLVILVTVSHAQFAQNEYNLRQLKLGNASGYSSVVRPTQQVDVQIKFSLLAVNGLDTRGQSLSTTGWLTVKWQDPRLTWTPASHGNIDFLFETQKVLWRPELVLDNAVDALGVIGDDDLLIRVAHTGEVLWEPPELFTTSCEIDVTHYPFDRQRCTLEITSWAYTIKEVNLTHLASQVYLGDYSLNGEWHIQDSSVTTKLMVESEGAYSQIDFIIVLQRRSYFYVVNLILPTVLLSFLSVVTFVLPFESGEKVSYALTVLLAYSVFMLLVSDNIPPTSLHVSVLGIYLALTLFVGASSTVMAVINLYFFHHNPLVPIIGKKRSFINKFLVPITSWEKPESKWIQTSSKNKIEPLHANSNTKSKNKNDEPDPEGVILEAVYTWKDVAAMSDIACFRIYTIFVSVLTVVFVITLPVGGYVNR